MVNVVKSFENVIQVKDLATVEWLVIKHGKICIKELPVEFGASCNYHHNNCTEPAEYLTLFYSSLDSDDDSFAMHCSEHKNKTVELAKSGTSFFTEVPLQ